MSKPARSAPLSESPPPGRKRDLSSPRAFAHGEVTLAHFVIPGEAQWRPGTQRRARARHEGRRVGLRRSDFTLDAFGAVFSRQ